MIDCTMYFPWRPSKFLYCVYLCRRIIVFIYFVHGRDGIEDPVNQFILTESHETNMQMYATRAYI